MLLKFYGEMPCAFNARERIFGLNRSKGIFLPFFDFFPPFLLILHITKNCLITFFSEFYQTLDIRSL